jgi:hypothetical protein
MSTLEVNTVKPISGSNTITLGESGDTIALASGASQTLAVNKPAFRATRPSNQTLTDASNTKIQFNSEDFDTDNCYDSTTNYRFTPTSSGKYVVTATIRFLSDANSRIATTNILFFKNGSEHSNYPCNYRDNNHNGITMHRTDIISFNGTSDYLEVYGNCDVDSGGIVACGGSTTTFIAYRIIGV